MAGDDLPRGLTPREVARILRVAPVRVRAWIKRGILGAVNVAGAKCAKARFVILPHHLAEFERTRAAGPAPKPVRPFKRITPVDYFPDD
jgi:hypothetical protein